MAIVQDLDQRDIERREEWEDREFREKTLAITREHELRMLKQRLRYTTRSRLALRAVLGIVGIVPKTFTVIGITLLILAGRSVPNSLYEYLAS